MEIMNKTTNNKLLFSLGQTVATPGALELLEENGRSPSEFLARHHRGEWGDLDDEDKQANALALKDGSRLFSSYKVGNGKLWIISESDRSSTTLLLPIEY